MIASGHRLDDVRGYTLRQAAAFMAAIDRREAAAARAALHAQALATRAGVHGGEAADAIGRT